MRHNDGRLKIMSTTLRKKYPKFQFKYLSNIKKYLFSTKTLIWFKNYFFLLSKHLFSVSKCLIGIQINIYLNFDYFFLSTSTYINLRIIKLSKYIYMFNLFVFTYIYFLCLYLYYCFQSN